MSPKRKTKKEEAEAKKEEKKDEKLNEEEKKEEEKKEEEKKEEEKQVDEKQVDEKKVVEKKKKEDKEEPQESDNEESDDDEESTDDENRGRGKRKRRSSVETAFEPVDFTMSDKTGVKIIKGRGEPLKNFPAVVASIEKHNTEDVLFAHKFLFGNRGAHLKKKDLINNLLEFNGYLKAVPKGYDKKKLEAEDEIEETKYSKKAFKLLLIQVKMLVTFFHVEDCGDDGKKLNKEDMLENLLDFLSQPNSDFLKPDPTEPPQPKRKKATPKKTKSVSKSPDKSKTAKEMFALVRKHSKGTKPTDDTLRQWVQAYVVSFDMDSATTKHAIKTASDKFGVDLTGIKDRIKELLAEEM